MSQEAVGAVENDDCLDGVLSAQVHFPPGIFGVLLRVGLAAVAVVARGVAVDAAAGVAAIRRVFLGGFALPSNVAALRIDFHFRQRQRPSLARQLNANETPLNGLAFAR